MTEKEQALAYLGRDPVLNISMTEPLRLGRAQPGCGVGNGRHRHGGGGGPR